MSNSTIPALVINLPEDIERRHDMERQFAKLGRFSLRTVAAVRGASLPDAVCFRLVERSHWIALKGTIGCFLSHVSAWEQVAQMSEPFAVILEDDVDVTSLALLGLVRLPADVEIVFINNRMCPASPREGAPEVLPMWHALEHLDLLRSGPGGDGYVLTPSAAKKLVSACREDLYFGHVDGRLLRYATSTEDLARLPADSWIAHVIKTHHDEYRMPALGLLRGYVLSYPLVRHRGISSRRETEDDGKAARTSHRIHGASRQASVEMEARSFADRQEPGPIPIRYWNRARNIGDAINPYIIEALTGRPPFYCFADDAEHLLGIGSLFFMANHGSHIWGSGIMDPAKEYRGFDSNKIHAVRGQLTLDLLRKNHDFTRDIPLGDPGIFVTSIPEVAAFQSQAAIRAKVAVIPHHNFADHPYFRELAAQSDWITLDPRTIGLDFLKQFIEAEIVVSQSLHGLIFAEVFNKPYVWISHSGDPVWTFKFLDWFSNTVEPFSKPLPLGSSPQELIGSARLAGLDIDRAALLHALPAIPSGGRKPGIGFRESRARPYGVLKIGAGDPLSGILRYDAVFDIPAANEADLRNRMNEYGRQFDDGVAVILVFDEAVYRDMSQHAIFSLLDILDQMPELHYIGYVPDQERNSDRHGPTVKRCVSHVPVHPWSERYEWTGVVIARHAINFSHQAPGAAVFASAFACSTPADGVP